jgi:hypothetical protein
MSKILIDEAVVRQSLEALEEATPHLPVHTDWHFEAIAALRQALEQPAQQEPISILRYEPEIYREDRIRMELDSDGDWVKYADVFALIAQSPQPAPAPAQPLTDEQCCHVCGKPLKAVAHRITKGN